MKVLDIMSESMRYPFNNGRSFLMVCAVCFVMSILAVVMLAYDTSVIGLVCLIIFILLVLLLEGFSISIMRTTLEGSLDLPQFSVVSDFVMGIRSIIVTIVYVLIPLIITAIVAYAVGFFSTVSSIMDQFNIMSAADPNATFNVVFYTLPEDVLTSFSVQFLTVFIVALILFILFIFLERLALGRLAETGSIVKSINFVEVFRKISSIGWVKYICFYILLIIILAICNFIGSLLSQFVPILGIIISITFILAFTMIFSSRAIGLIYADG